KWARRRPTVAALSTTVVGLVVFLLITSWALVAWALRQRDDARHRLKEAQEADRRRVESVLVQLCTATPEAVPTMLQSLAEDRETILPHLRELWADEHADRVQRTRAGLALLGDDPSVAGPLAGWMLETADPREVLLIRDEL